MARRLLSSRAYAELFGVPTGSDSLICLSGDFDCHSGAAERKIARSLRIRSTRDGRAQNWFPNCFSLAWFYEESFGWGQYGEHRLSRARDRRCSPLSRRVHWNGHAICTCGALTMAETRMKYMEREN